MKNRLSINIDAKYIILTLLSFIILTGCGKNGKNLPDKVAELNAPYTEWELNYPDYSGNPFDVVAWATFTHEESGKQKKSLMFYDSKESLWKFRFTGTKTGIWEIKTEGPGSLGGYTGTVDVTASDYPLPGFFTSRGKAWIWKGTGKEFVPQFVMAGSWDSFLKDGKAADTAKMNRVIREFIVETGFTGFHFAGGGGRWFNITENNTLDEQENPTGEQDPDMRTFKVMEEFLVRSYQQEAATHIWMWGSDKWASSGPAGIGGPMSVTDKRILRYIAGRLGPIPGWSMGYGYDLYAWADAEQLQNWYDFLKDHLGGWPHLIGARADNWDANNRQLRKSQAEGLPRAPLSEIYWEGDYTGHYDYRVPYSWYSEVLDHSEKPQFQEDRFRIREHETFENKDYTPGMTVRGLWHSTMAGGVANIWGNLLPDDNGYGSQPYSNKAEGVIQNFNFTIDIKEEIKTYNKFWFEKGRFSYDLIRDNELTGNQKGNSHLLPAGGGSISVCLRSRNKHFYVFYSENTDSVRMDLRDAENTETAVAVDTRKPYNEINIGNLNSEDVTWKAPYQSDWAIAVGNFEN